MVLWHKNALIEGAFARRENRSTPTRDEVRSADYTLHIRPSPVEIGPKRIISATTYNGQFPGPLLRFKEGREVVVDVYNDTDTPEQLHWHGQKVSTDVDGAAEEGTPFVPANGKRRLVFTPNPSGLRFYHTHNRAGANLAVGQYSGEVGPVYIEPKDEPGRYDRESAMKASLAKGMPHGYEVGYASFTINGRMLGHGEPIRVKQGQRVLFHILNGSATEIRSLALPGHSFQVVALDGNPVPHQASVPVLWLGTAERISAIVEMNHPGVWIMGDLDNDDRRHGMGIVVEYSNRPGKPQWIAPAPFKWDYRRFGQNDATSPAPDETIEMTFAKDNAALDGFNRWTINGTAYPISSQMSSEPGPVSFHLTKGKRYRIRMRMPVTTSIRFIFTGTVSS
jgi:FtsP/CotA-like multicopper oxidase with cupredoxin domain